MLARGWQALIASYYHTQWQQEIGWWQELGPLLAVHYDYEWQEERRTADYFFAWGVPAREVVSLIRDYDPAPEHQILVLADKKGIDARYEAAGCQLVSEEYLMWRPPEPVPVEDGPWQVQVVSRPGDILFLNMMEGAGGIRLSDLRDPLLRFYYVLDEGQPVGQARTARLAEDLCWIANVQTVPSHRRRGVGRALMAHILGNSVREGLAMTMLLATAAGRRLYQNLAYRDLAPVSIFRLAG